MNTFETNRLQFRPLQHNDIDNLYLLYKQKDLMQYITGQPRDYQKTQQRLSAHITDYQKYGFSLYATILKTTNQFIGRCGIEPVETNNQLHADIAWMFKKQYWGQGLATEFGHAMLSYAFKNFPIHRIFATAHPQNIASIKVMQKIGMQHLKTTPTRVFYETWNPKFKTKN